MLDDRQRERRQRFLGSSDAAAVAGLDAFGRTPGDVWLEKTGRVRPRPRDERDPVKQLGSYLEETLLRWVSDVFDVGIERDVMLVHPNDVMCANLDGIGCGAPRFDVEAKTAGLIGTPHFLDDFGESGTGDVPRHVRLQVQHQLAVCRANPETADVRWAIIPALIVRKGFVWYRIPAHEPTMDALVEIEERFWRDHVLADKPPPDPPSLDGLARRERDGTVAPVPISDALVEAWDVARRTVALAKAHEEDMKRAVLAALGDAETGECGLGTLTYKQQTRAAFVSEEATFRVLRLKQPAGKRRRSKGEGA